MPTPLTELLEFIESGDAFEIEDVYNKAQSLLQKERVMVSQAFYSGGLFIHSGEDNPTIPDLSTYIEKLYNQQP